MPCAELKSPGGSGPRGPPRAAADRIIGLMRQVDLPPIQASSVRASNARAEAPIGRARASHPPSRLRGRIAWIAIVLAGASWAGVGRDAAASGSQAAHVHGQVQLDVALDARRLLLELSIPMESLTGFERAPRNEGEREQLDKALSLLRSPGIIRPPTQAACQPAVVHIDPPASAGSTGSDGHADVLARYVLDCAHMGELKAIDLGLFDAFSRIRRIEARIVDSRGSGKQTLTRAQRTLKLAR